MKKLAIIGYGNLGKACERLAVDGDEFEVEGIFSRRDPSTLYSPYGTSFFKQSDIFDFEDIDVAVICTGSARDVQNLAYSLARKFNVVDSFDTHALLPDYVVEMNEIALSHDRLCYCAVGWDPGLFSLVRALFTSLTGLDCVTFWGRGVSQGHSEAIRRIDGVLDAKQYTVPIPSAMMLAADGKAGALTDRQKHRRECYVVAKEGADKANIVREIVNIPNYFEPYDTSVYFVDEEEFATRHAGMSHGGKVICAGEIAECKTVLQTSLELESNPYFTARIMLAYAAANARAYAMGDRGARTALDIPVSLLAKTNFVESIRKFV